MPRQPLLPTERWQRLLDNPTLAAGLHEEYPSNRNERAAFRRFAGDRFDDWHRRALTACEEEADPGRLELFREDWHPDGVRAYQRERQFEMFSESLRAARNELASDELYEELKSLAREEGRSVAEIVADAVRFYRERRLTDGRA